MNINGKTENDETVTGAAVAAVRKTETLQPCGGPSTASESGLLRYSLSGEGNALKETAQQQFPLLANITLMGQTSVWYGPPNTGKTLICLSLLLLAISEGRVQASSVFYVNADDSASGMADKAMILDDVGVHTLAPGFKGFKMPALAPAMEAMAKEGSAKGCVIIIDTLKKVADLMSKRESAEFAKAARAFSMHGGTVIGLAHTNKHRNSSGRLIHAGTSDILEDFDTAYILEAIPHPSKPDNSFVRFEALKRRGDNDEKACFSYSKEVGQTYAQRLLSIEEADPEYGPVKAQRKLSEAEIILSIKAAITHGSNTKMRIASIVSHATRVSRKSVLDVLETHCGPDPQMHHWDYERKARGAHVFFLHAPTDAVLEGQG